MDNKTFASILSAFESAGVQKGIVYVSVPITSGKMELRLLKTLGCSRDEMLRYHKDRWIKEVVNPNRKRAKIVVSKIRKANPCEIVVDPSPLDVDGWTQKEYHDFWVLVVTKYAKKVVASSGWIFSRGCRREISAAINSGIPIIDTNGKIVDRKRILRAEQYARREVTRSLINIEDRTEYLEPMP